MKNIFPGFIKWSFLDLKKRTSKNVPNAIFKDGHISLYCHFNQIIKSSGTSFQSPAVSQKHVRNACQTAH